MGFVDIVRELELCWPKLPPRSMLFSICAQIKNLPPDTQAKAWLSLGKWVGTVEKVDSVYQYTRQHKHFKWATEVFIRLSDVWDKLGADEHKPMTPAEQEAIVRKVFYGPGYKVINTPG